MAVKRNQAVLVIASENHPSAFVSELLGREPTDAHEIGDPRGIPAAQRHPESKAPTHYARSAWTLMFNVSEDADDPDGTASLRMLIDAIGGKAELLAQLRPRYETIIRWSGFSDSTQGGFVIDAGLFPALAALGCDLYGTVYLDGPET